MRCSLILVVMISYLFPLSAGAGTSSVLSEDEDDLALGMHLKMLNKPYVKSFKDDYGVIFDCVDMYKQPALDHPLLKNHTLQISSSASTLISTNGTEPSTSREPSVRFGLRESCPDGTVPIRRTHKQDLRRASVSLSRFRLDKESSGVAGQHFALLMVDSEKGSKFQAAGAIVEVDTAEVPTGQRSSAQILLIDDSSSRVSVVQSGWLIAPDIAGDSQTRFMTYWTADDYTTTGCFNMLCPGFVVVSQTATPGMVLPTGSGATSISISMDGQTGNWQVFLNQEIVGYFPKEIINGMSGATEVQMGGITFAPPGQKSPPMGTGVAPVAGEVTLASKFTEAGVQGANIAKNWVTKDVSDPAIYNIVMTSFTGPDGNAFQ
ncbi:unnamed protein product, partial [Urochloa humidicola]